MIRQVVLALCAVNYSKDFCLSWKAKKKNIFKKAEEVILKFNKLFPPNSQKVDYHL